MKGIQYSLRLFIIVGSLSGFFGGWALFAHAGKPGTVSGPSATDVSAPNIAPQNLPPLNFNAPQQLQPLQPIPPQSQARTPRLRTRSS
jgi:hypothetical protein